MLGPARARQARGDERGAVVGRRGAGVDPGAAGCPAGDGSAALQGTCERYRRDAWRNMRVF